jgi:hypothetical protein
MKRIKNRKYILKNVTDEFLKKFNELTNNKVYIIYKVIRSFKKNFPEAKYKIEFLNDEYNTIYFIIDKKTFIQEKFKKWRFKIQRNLIWKVKNLHIGFDYEQEA